MDIKKLVSDNSRNRAFNEWLDICTYPVMPLVYWDFHRPLREVNMAFNSLLDRQVEVEEW